MLLDSTLPTEITIDEAAVVLKALADPNRLRILAALMEGDTCNCELVERLGLPANLLSHHLKVLSEAQHQRQDRRKAPRQSDE